MHKLNLNTETKTYSYMMYSEPKYADFQSYCLVLTYGFSLDT